MKIALLFLTITNIYHEPYWKQFLKGNESKYSIYVHAKNGVPPQSFFKPYELATTTPTTWANTMNAQKLLLQEALKDPHNQKFIFLSESTLPLQSFEKTYSTVMNTTNSLFAYTRNPHQDPHDPLFHKRSLNTIPMAARYKCSQWIILNRKHAQKIANDSYYMNLITQYEADNELYPASFLSSQGLLSEVLAIDKTYVNWKKHNPPGTARSLPYIFTNLNNADEFYCIIKAIGDGFLFARKFAPNARLLPLHSYLRYMHKEH